MKRIKAKHGKKAKDHRPIKEVIAFYRSIELTPKQLASVKTLSPDGGDLAYVHAMNVWDGEDGQFGIASLDGIDALVNLEEFTPIAMMSEDGVDYSAIALCSKLKKLDMTFAKSGKKSDALAAKDYFLEQADQPKAPLKSNDLGGTIGGPIVKDKLQFFFSEEWNKETRGQTRAAFVPTAAERVGDFSAGPIEGCSGMPVDPTTGEAFLGNRIPANQLSPAGLLVMKLYPLPNVTPQPPGRTSST